jgi:hypothetical protein
MNGLKTKNEYNKRNNRSHEVAGLRLKLTIRKALKRTARTGFQYPIGIYSTSDEKVSWLGAFYHQVYN